MDIVVKKDFDDMCKQLVKEAVEEHDGVKAHRYGKLLMRNIIYFPYIPTIYPKLNYK